MKCSHGEEFSKSLKKTVVGGVLHANLFGSGTSEPAKSFTKVGEISIKKKE